jgi:thioredoxin-related protein
VGLISLLFLVTAQAQTFVHDFEESKELAQNGSKQILMIFSGSDWCKPCIQMKQNIISNESFTAFANENLVLLEVDFPYKKKNKLSKEQTIHNEALAEKFNQKGTFPLLVVFDKEGNVQQSIGYNSQLSPEDYIQLIQVEDKPAKSIDHKIDLMFNILMQTIIH